MIRKRKSKLTKAHIMIAEFLPDIIEYDKNISYLYHYNISGPRNPCIKEYDWSDLLIRNKNINFNYVKGLNK